MDEKTLEWLSKHREGKRLKTSLHLIIPLLLLSALTGAVLEVSNFFGISIAFALYYLIIFVTEEVANARAVEVKRFEVVSFVLLTVLLVPKTLLSTIQFPIATKSIGLSAIALALPAATLLCRTSTKPNRKLLLLSVYACVISCVTAAGLTVDRRFVVTIPTVVISALGVGVICGTTMLFRMHVNIRAQHKLFFVLALLSGFASVYCYYLATVAWLHAAITVTVATAMIFAYLDYVKYQMRRHVSEWTDETAFRAICHVVVKITAVWAIVCWGGMISFFDLSAGGAKKNADAEALRLTIFIIHLAGCHAIHEAAKSQTRKNAQYEKMDHKTLEGIPTIVIAMIFGDISVMMCIGGYFCFALRPLAIPQPWLLMAVAALFLLLTYLLDSISSFMAEFNQKLQSACAGFMLYLVVFIFYSMSNLDHSKRVNSTDVTEGNAVNDGGEEWRQQFYPISVSLVALFYCVPLQVHLYNAIAVQRNSVSSNRSERRRAENVVEWHLNNGSDSDDDDGHGSNDRRQLI